MAKYRLAVQQQKHPWPRKTSQVTTVPSTLKNSFHLAPGATHSLFQPEEERF